MNKYIKTNFAEMSYALHEKHLKKYLTNKILKKHSETWILDDTVDAWRHARMRNFILPVIKEYPKASWLTVGDGRYGNDAHYIEKNGGKVVATDISDDLLKIAKNNKFISNFKKENAEKISFKNNSFDFVFCKESLHHFPRPMIAFYEMLRVASKALILIEPQDSPSLFQSLMMSKFKKAKNSGIGNYFNSFEDAGNYVYKVSLREIEKISTAMQFPEFAYAGFNDFYIYGVEYQKSQKLSLLFLKIRIGILIMDTLSKFGLMKEGLLKLIIFKEKPTRNLKNYLIDLGFKFVELPSNPYIK